MWTLTATGSRAGYLARTVGASIDRGAPTLPGSRADLGSARSAAAGDGGSALSQTARR